MFVFGARYFRERFSILIVYNRNIYDWTFCTSLLKPLDISLPVILESWENYNESGNTGINGTVQKVLHALQGLLAATRAVLSRFSTIRVTAHCPLCLISDARRDHDSPNLPGCVSTFLMPRHFVHLHIYCFGSLKDPKERMFISTLFR